MAVMTSTDRLNEYADESEMRMCKGVDGGMGQEDSFFGPLKLLAMGFIGVCFLATIIISILNGLGSGLPLLGITLVLTFFLTRYVILEEKKYTEIFAQSHFEESQPAEIFDDVMRVSAGGRNTPAFVYLGTGETCLVIQVQHGSIVGKGVNYEIEYYDALSDALRFLELSDYTVIRKQVMINCREDPRLQALGNDGHYMFDNPAVKDLIGEKLGYLRNISAEVQYEQEYWYIYTKRTAYEETFLIDVSRAVSMLRSVARLTHICTQVELMQLNQEELGCSNAGLGEHHANAALTLRDMRDFGLYLAGIGLEEYTLQEASLQNYYSGDAAKYDKYVLGEGVLHVDDLLGLLESHLDATKVQDLKNDLYAKYITTSDTYKKAMADAVAAIDWSDDDEDDD